MFEKFKRLSKEKALALLQNQLVSARALKNSKEVDQEYLNELLRDINLLELYIKTMKEKS